MAMPSAMTLGSLALVFVAGAGLAVMPIFGGDANDQSAASLTGPSSTEPSSTPTSSPPTTAGSSRSSGRHKHNGAEPVPKTLVVVYNNSGITGLAAEKAAYLQGAGWNVAATDNWYGSIPANTVYYPPNLKAQAEQLARQLNIDRLHPAVSPMQFDRLTVIFTSGD